MESLRESGGGSVGYIQFSSRLDLGARDPVWGDVWRGATARRLLDSETVRPENMVFIGANGYVPLEQWQMAERLPAAVITAEQVRSRGIPDVISEALERASHNCSGVFVGIDIDVMDGGYVAMTGAPRFDGLRNVDLFEAMPLLARARSAVSASVRPQPPHRDHEPRQDRPALRRRNAHPLHR